MAAINTPAPVGLSSEAGLTFEWLNKLASQDSPEKLEAGMVVGMNVLTNLRNMLAPAKKIKAVSKLIVSMKNMRDSAKMKRTVVGVVGGTGSGEFTYRLQLPAYSFLD